MGKQRQPHCNPGKSWCKRCFWINTYSEDFHLQRLPYFWCQNVEVLLPARLSRLHCPKQMTKNRKGTAIPVIPPWGGTGLGLARGFWEQLCGPLLPTARCQQRQSRASCSSQRLPAAWWPFCRALPLLPAQGNSVSSIQQLPLPECKGGLRTWMERGEQREAAQRNN